MFENVIVGVDGAEGGRDAIALAKWLRGPEGKLTFVHVYAGAPGVWRGASATYDALEQARAEQLLEKARDEAAFGAQVLCYVASTIGRGLHELAEDVGADLLVVGSSRRGLLGRVLIGDDTRAALNGAPCAVAIAPAGYSQHPVVIREVGVGYDGSPEAKHALGVARKLADARGARSSAFEAVCLPAAAYTLSGGLPPQEFIEELVAAARDRVAGIEGVEAHAAYGQPAEELALYSASLDLLVVGSRGYGPVGRLVHGSTAQQLARMARCPLLVMTRAARKMAAPPVAEHGRKVAATGPAG